MAPLRIATELVERHDDWIRRHAAKIEAQRAARDARPALGAGRSLPVLGVDHDVHVVPAIGRRRSRIVRGAGRIVVERSISDKRSVAQMLEAWLRAYAREVIAERVGRRAVDMDLEVQRITIRDQRTRWGSASHNGTLSFSWRLVMSPPGIIDYVVVHELAHLRHSGHGRRFWQLVNRHFPESAAARRWLRLSQDALRHALD